MQQEMEKMIAEFTDAVGNYAKEKGTISKTIKQHNKNKDDGYKTISFIIDFETFKVRFAYHINEGVVFKKGIITLYFNIGDFEYHFSDILAHIAPRDKECIVYPYIDDIDTMKTCVNELSKKLDKYRELIDELVASDTKRRRLENSLKKEIRIFSGREVPKEGPLALMLSGIYSNTSLIRYTSEPYECFVNGNYKKALKLYNKEGNLALYEKQLVKNMERAIKTKKQIDIPETQKTINHKKEVDKETNIYNLASFVMLLPLTFIICMLLFIVFSNTVTQGSLVTITRSWIFLIIPTVAVSGALTPYFRNYVFKDKIQSTLKLYALYETNKLKRRKTHYINAVCIASIITIGIMAASSISLREDGIKYSHDILDFKGTIVPYNDIMQVNIEKQEIKLNNGEVIYLNTYTLDNEVKSKLENILEKYSVNVIK